MNNNTETRNWSEQSLLEARKIKDSIADKFVAELARTKSEKELYLIMQFLLNEYVWLDEDQLDELSRQYLTTASKLPSWADPELIKKGEDFFAMHGFEISMVLMMKALPATYSCRRGAEVVHATGRMTDHSGNLRPFTRRLMQTSKFVLNVLSKDGLVGHGVGVRSAVKVRTLHAFIRYFLESKNWDVEKYGAPINQEDYAGTMLSFSVFVVEGLESLGIKVSKEEKTAYFHVWRVVAHLVGIEENLLAKDYEEGARLGHAILDQQKGASQSGKELTQACLEFMQGLMPIKILRFLPANMMYFLLGPEISEMVGIRKSRNVFVNAAFFVIRMVLHLVEWLKHHVGFVGRFAIKYNPIMLDFIIQKFLKETKNYFTPEIIQSEVKTITHKQS